MAQRVRAFPSDDNGSLNEIRKEWMDGKVWKIELRNDFAGSVFDFESACAMAAELAGMSVKTELHVQNELRGWTARQISYVYVQFTKTGA